jgi:uncharacterized protein (TIGR03435 family)
MRRVAAMKKVFGLLLAIAGLAAAQGEASFEVASIKLHPEPIAFSSDAAVHGARVTATAVTLIDLITNAFGVRYDQISGGPSWAKSEHYDVAAKAEGEDTITKNQLRQMLQTLLAGRFQLQLHREMRETPVYELIVAKNGPKIKEAAPDATGGYVSRGFNTGQMRMEASKGTMEQLARQLSVTAGRPVIDKTGLTGYYAYTLDWASAIQPPQPDSDSPSMFTAVQEQLGLKLESAKDPIEMLIIDRAEKPSEN